MDNEHNGQEQRIKNALLFYKRNLNKRDSNRIKMNTDSTKTQIIKAADQLFYQQGFEHTSFAHIADAVNISRGNFYYHFKTKDEILAAVIQLRLTNTQNMLNRWQQEGKTPAERIRCFIHILIMNQTYILRFGCPVGTLTTELSKLKHLAQADANKLFILFKDWLKQQFTQLQHEENAEYLAIHLLGRSQGIAILANAFNNETILKQEVKQLNIWLNQYT